MVELPVSASLHASRTPEGVRRSVTKGIPGTDVAVAGSKLAISRRPLDWRAIVAVALYAFPVALGAAWAQFPPGHPLTYPTSTRPCLSMVTSKKSSRLRQMLAPPPFHIQPRCIGAPGVTSDVVQVNPPSKVWAT